jgi:drug/metabolite transporter (DMT)-like permease
MISAVRLGELAALGTAFCWAGTALAFAAAGRRIGSLVVNLLRLLCGLALLTLAAWLARGQALPSDASAAAWGWLALSGLVGFVLGDLCLFRAFVEIGPRLSSLVMCLAPPFAALISWFLTGETLAAREVLGMALVASGIGWAIAERHPAPPVAADPGTVAPANPRHPPRASLRGLLLALGGAAGQAGGLVLSKRGMGSYHFLAATQIRVLAGIIGFSLLFVALGWWPQVRAALADRRALAYTATGAFFGPFLGVSLSLFAVQHAPTGVAASLMAISPLLIIPVVMLRGEERVGLGGIAGALLAVGGVALLFS